MHVISASASGRSYSEFLLLWMLFNANKVNYSVPYPVIAFRHSHIVRSGGPNIYDFLARWKRRSNTSTSVINITKWRGSWCWIEDTSITTLENITEQSSAYDSPRIHARESLVYNFGQYLEFAGLRSDCSELFCSVSIEWQKVDSKYALLGIYIN